MFGDVFNIMGMASTYESRKVGKFENDELMVSTALVTDGYKPYETAILHPEYRGGDYVIVEAYDTKEEAGIGHNKWVMLLTAEKLPEELVYVPNSDFGREECDGKVSVTFPRIKRVQS